MRFNTLQTSRGQGKASGPGRQRQLRLLGLLGAFLTLAACGDGTERGQVGYVEGFYGAVVADEPRAAEIGRDILTAGGNAIDAAVATYFALAVTLPSSASLSGGGACVVHNRITKKVEVIDFPARAGGGKVPVAVPANVRGMALLQTRGTVLRWEELVAPAERLARLGTPVSRVFARDLELAGRNLAQDPRAKAIFIRNDGTPLREGDNLVQSDLAAILGAIRSRGGGDFNSGPSGRAYIDGLVPMGGQVSIDDLRQTIASAVAPVSVPYGSHTLSFVPNGGGVLSAEIWQLVAQYGRITAAEGQRAHVMAEMTKRAYADRGTWLDAADRMVEDPGAILASARLQQLAAGFGDAATPVGSLMRQPRQRPADPPGVASWLAVDRFGNAVSCSVTTYGIFGVGGRVAGDTGVVISSAPGANGRGTASLTPVLMTNTNTGDLYFAGAASGGTPAPAALVQVMALAMLANMALPDAVGAPRALHLGAPDLVYAEGGDNSVADLRGRGHTVQELAPLGTVSAVYCPDGIRNGSSGCRAVADRRGHGLAFTSVRR